LVLGSARLGPVELRNRVIKAATFEGMTPDGLVTDELIDYHLRPVRGGVGMTTVAYCAVSPEGRTDRRQIWMRLEAVPAACSPPREGLISAGKTAQTDVRPRHNGTSGSRQGLSELDSLYVSARREGELDRTNCPRDWTRGGMAEKPAAEKLTGDPQDLIRAMPAEGDRPAGPRLTWYVSRPGLRA
jgi:hypothetical protein